MPHLSSLDHVAPLSTEPTPQLIRADEVARLFGLSVARVYEISRLGLLPAVKIGRSLRFSRHALLAFIESGGMALDAAVPVGNRSQPGSRGESTRDGR